MSHNVTKELNQVLKGEQMAVDFYENFIQNVDDDRIKKEFRQIQQDHMQHVQRLTGRIQDIGGKAEHGTGFTGYMADVATDMKSRRMEPADILKKAYEGENKGLTMVEELVKGDLDPESRSLVTDIRSEDKQHLESMQHLIDEYTGMH